MLQSLTEQINQDVKKMLPGLFGDKSPVVTITYGEMLFEQSDIDKCAGEPGPGQKYETITVNNRSPSGPFTLSSEPYGMQPQIWCIDRFNTKRKIKSDFVHFDKVNKNKFTIQENDLFNTAESLLVNYETLSVGTGINGTGAIHLACQVTDGTAYEKTEALLLTVLYLNRKQWTSCKKDYTDTSYSSSIEIKDISIIKSVPVSDKCFTIEIQVQCTLYARRSMNDNEDAVIKRVLTPGAQGRGHITIEPELD